MLHKFNILKLCNTYKALILFKPLAFSEKEDYIVRVNRKERRAVRKIRGCGRKLSGIQIGV